MEEDSKKEQGSAEDGGIIQSEQSKQSNNIKENPKKNNIETKREKHIQHQHQQKPMSYESHKEHKEHKENRDNTGKETREVKEVKNDVVTFKKPEFVKSIKKNPWIAITIILALVLAYLIFFKGAMTGGTISANEAGVKLVSFYEENGAEGISVDSVETISGVYQVNILYQGELIPIYITKDGKYAGPLSPISVGEVVNTNVGNESSVTVSNNYLGETKFLDTGDEICKDSSGKPYVILFSTTWCPHCEWIADTFDGLKNSANVGSINLQHWEIDIGDNTLTSEVEKEVPKDIIALYEKYNPEGTIPTFVFGCKYTKIGNSYESADDLDAELQDFNTAINALLA